MTRFSTFAVVATALTVALQAQCFESNFGVLAPRGANPPGVGDDFLFDPQPLNFVFPMGGAAATYTDAYFNSNGVIFLSNGVLAPLPTATGYSTATATQLTNLRGTAGQPPRIAPLWRDLNLLAANNGGCWVNNTIPGKFVVTWANAVQFGSTSPIFTVQAQLFPSGDIQFFYNGTLASTSATITGVSEGNAIAAVPGVDLSVGPNVAATRLIFEQFAANTIDLQTTGLLFTNSGTGYVQTAAPCVPANSTSFGAGCYAVPASGVYEAFTDSAVASAALQGNAMLLTRGAGGYSSTWVPGGAAALYVAPTVGATSLPANDDGTTVVTLPSPLSIVGGTVTQVAVSTNGVIALGGVASSNGPDFSPTGPEFAAAPIASFYSWHDYNANEAGSGTVKTELDVITNTFYITWDGVESYSTPASVNRSTWQIGLELVTGNVKFSWVTIQTDITSTFGSAHLVGWKGLGAVVDGGSQVLSSGSFTNVQNPIAPLTLTASGAPVVGSNVTFTHANIPPIAPGVFLSLLLVDIAEIPGGLDLGVIGAPGCPLYVPTLNIVPPTPLVGFSSTATGVAPSVFNPVVNFPGIDLFWQAAALVAPGLNPFGVVTSNGVRTRINTF